MHQGQDVWDEPNAVHFQLRGHEYYLSYIEFTLYLLLFYHDYITIDDYQYLHSFPRLGERNNQRWRRLMQIIEKNQQEWLWLDIYHFLLVKKNGFIGYCHKALNPAACRVPRTTLTRALFKIYKKEKKIG